MKLGHRLLRTILFSVAVIGGTGFANSAAGAQGTHQEFYEPRHPSGSGFLVDFCAFPGVECGLATALRFCQAVGFPNVVGFQGPVSQQVSTQRLGDGQVCSYPSPSCSSFSRITCQRGVAGVPQPQPQPFPQPQPQPQPATQVFDTPLMAGLPIDICVSPKQQCAGEAATLFCQKQGFHHAKTHNHAIFPTTAHISGGQCVPELLKVCGGYTRIVCAN